MRRSGEEGGSHEGVACTRGLPGQLMGVSFDLHSASAEAPYAVRGATATSVSIPGAKASGGHLSTSMARG